MPRSMWRGAIQFGLVTIPVKLYLATEPRGGLSFNLLHQDDLQHAVVARPRGDEEVAGERLPEGGADRVVDPPAYDEFLVIPLRVHVLSATDLP